MSHSIAILFLVTIVNVVCANHLDGGKSEIHRDQDASGKYSFGYHITDPWGSSNYRKESGDGWGQVHGSYGLQLADGQHRIVNYVADKGGFRADIQSNEPSVDSFDSADAIYNGPDPAGHSQTYVPSGYEGKQGGYSGHDNQGSYGYAGGHGYEHGPSHKSGNGYEHGYEHGHGQGHQDGWKN